ncbi:MAG TPA: hypothetical protein VMM35_02660, partial [Longimicrobiales bacterium]|nr:hypothetical protein [Longimicrobiales bacterium]
MSPIRILGYGSLGITLLGVALMARDVFAQEQSSGPWLPLVAGSVGLVVTAFWSAIADPEPKEPVVAPPATPRARTWIVAGVAVLLLVQSVVPLRYYLGDDLFDERFSWRMFSAVRVYSCDLNAFETREGHERPTPLMSTIHVAWITTMRRGREGVIRRYLRWRCEQEGVEAARVINRCTTPEG